MQQERIRLVQDQLQQIDEIALISHSHIKTVDWLREYGVLQNVDSFYCDGDDCEENEVMMVWIQDNFRVDFRRFECRECGAKRSLRYRSIYYELKTELIKLFRLTFVSLIKRTPINQVAKDMNLERHTVSSIYKRIRDTISKYYEQIEQERLGYIPIEEFEELDNGKRNRFYSPCVECDVTLITHLTGKQENANTQCWVIGALLIEPPNNLESKPLVRTQHKNVLKNSLEKML